MRQAIQSSHGLSENATLMSEHKLTMHEFASPCSNDSAMIKIKIL